MCEVVDSFTVYLHSPNDRYLPAVGAAQGDFQWPPKKLEIPIGHVSPQSIVTGVIPTYI